MSEQISRFKPPLSNAAVAAPEFVNPLWGSAHHVQAATVHECSELMKADLCGVQYSLNLLQTLLGIRERKY